MRRVKKFVHVRERERETKTQNKNSFIIVSSVVATLLCGVLHASESDFADKKVRLLISITYILTLWRHFHTANLYRR